MGFEIEKDYIFYWSPIAEMFVNCGINPVDWKVTISPEDFENKEVFFNNFFSIKYWANNQISPK